MKKILSIGLLTAVALSGCNSIESNNSQTINSKSDIQAAYNTINANQLAEHVKVLASDEFEGRAPSTKGEQLTLDYLTDNLTKLGFKPGNGDSFLQAVPMVSLEASPEMILTIGSQAKGDKTYQYGKDMVMGSSRITELSELNHSELVFVGYGINAPEYNWNDYQGIDVKGKTVVILVNDPGYASQDPALFTGNAMTYYGRWTYKYEEASRQGAAGAIIIHETAPASYGWSVVANSWSGPQFGFDRDDLNKDRVAVEGWINAEVAAELFDNASLNFKQAKEMAAKGSYHVEMGDLTASVTVKNTVKKSTSYNFIATLPGRTVSDEHILYSAHWDHLGKNTSLEGDQIYNGAVDNATGTAALIEIAKAFASLPVKPERSITIIAVTAEEQGLLGSKYYAANPVIPANKTVANINMDALGVNGRSSDVSVYGLGQSELDDYLTVAAKKQGRTIAGDPRPAAGIYYRSDHFAFANIGIPALYAKSGKTPVDEATRLLREQLDPKLAKCYHNLCDEFTEEWDLSGAVEDIQAFFEVGYELSSANIWPKWSEKSEFSRK